MKHIKVFAISALLLSSNSGAQSNFPNYRDADSRLNATYRSLASALTQGGRLKLRNEQRAWIASLVETARALAPLSQLVGHAAALLAPDGVALFPKGRNAEAELTAAATRWHMTTERFPSRTDPEATIFRIRNIRPARPLA